MLTSLCRATGADITFDALQTISKEMVKDGTITVVKPSLHIDNKKVSHSVAEVEEFGLAVLPADLAKYYWILRDCVTLELEKEHLFDNDEDRKLMHPFFQAEEGVLRAKVAIANRHRGDVESLTKKLNAVNSNALQRGLAVWARQHGYEFQGETAPARAAEVKVLLAKEGAAIRLCLNTVYLLAKVAGKEEDAVDFPWQSYRHGDRIQIAGTVRFKITYRGKSVTLVQDVPFETTRLVLPVE